MANYKGRDFLLKLGAWSGGTEVTECREHTLRFNHETVDTTNKGSSGKRALLDGAGTSSVTVTFGGVMNNGAGFETFQGYATTGSINSYALAWADGDVLEGSFQVTSYEIAGTHNGEQTFTATLESSGSWTFTAA